MATQRTVHRTIVNDEEHLANNQHVDWFTWFVSIVVWIIYAGGRNLKDIQADIMRLP